MGNAERLRPRRLAEEAQVSPHGKRAPVVEINITQLPLKTFGNYLTSLFFNQSQGYDFNAM